MESKLQPKSPQHSHELCDIQRGYEFIDLTNQIPPLHNNIFETLGDDDKEDTVEWNEGDELGQTDEDQAIVMTWNLNENIILVNVVLMYQMSQYRCEKRTYSD